MAKQPVILVILDGWGLGRKDESNPIYLVKPKTFEYLEQNFPMTSLQASGIAVGLPWGEVGNSEVGHLTLGAGKVLYQYYPKIILAIKDKTFFGNKELLEAINHSKKNNKPVNFVGLLSNGNVHASIEHLLALIDLAKEQGVDYKLHLFADGKDSHPKSILDFLKMLPLEKLATLTGRYYAMDREERYELTKQTYEAMTAGQGKKVEDLKIYLEEFLKTNQSEEFLPPLRLGGEEKNIAPGEGIIFFNYREDSIRQLASSFILPDFSSFERKLVPDTFVTIFTPYSEEFKVPVAFPPDQVENCLGKVLSDAGKVQLRVAETYKYAHITYFFNGHREAPFPNEYRVIIPSEPIPHPDEHPEMMAAQISDRVMAALEDGTYDFILVNYANPDAIAHTGNYAAAKIAVQVIDSEMQKVIKAAADKNAILLITSDHGNMEEIMNPISGRPETQHDPNPVPFYLVHESWRGRKFMNYTNLQETMGILSDVAPTILELMNLPKPEEMTGESLLKKLL